MCDKAVVMFYIITPRGDPFDHSFPHPFPLLHSLFSSLIHSLHLSSHSSTSLFPFDLLSLSFLPRTLYSSLPASIPHLPLVPTSFTQTTYVTVYQIKSIVRLCVIQAYCLYPFYVFIKIHNHSMNYKLSKKIDRIISLYRQSTYFYFLLLDEIAGSNFGR